MEAYKVRVENAQGQTIAYRGFVIANYDLDTWPEQYYVTGSDYVTLYNRYHNNYQVDLSRSFFYFAPPYIETTDSYNVYQAFGFTNYAKITQDSVGEKFIFKNGSYIEITSVTMNNYNYFTMKLNYCVSDGRVAYRDITISSNGTDHFCEVYGIPWRRYKRGGDHWDLVLTYLSTNYAYTTCQIWLSATSATSEELARMFFEGLDPIDPDDPYPDDDSDDDDPDDPDGIPDPDPIPFPDDPTIDVLDSGFITLFAPTKAQVRTLADYMWSGGFDINTFRKIFADPMDCILGFNILPFTVPRGSLGYVVVGNISTGVEMYEASGQWVTIDCGSLDLGKIYDTYLDYAPYTKWSIYLPFIGLQQLSTDDVAHKTLHLKYKIDVLSCSCVAYIMCGDSILYQYSGSCGYSIPVTSDNFARMISNIVSIATTGASLVASGGATAPMAVGAMSSIANNVMGLKPDVKRGGSIGASAGLMGVQKPYVIIEIPRICKPKRQHYYLGYPSFITKKVDDVSGYTEWESIVLDGIPCTDSERDEILEVMKGGCYV